MLVFRNPKASPWTVTDLEEPCKGFTVTGSNVGVNETITVSGEVLSFFNTGIDTRVYFIKNF